MESAFYSCSSLKSFPDIFSKWNIDKVNNMNYMFKGCLIVKSLPSKSSWKLEKIKEKKEMFGN